VQCGAGDGCNGICLPDSGCHAQVASPHDGETASDREHRSARA
jgi:hypothetical protein